jgi:uncharacterized membrane protein
VTSTNDQAEERIVVNATQQRCVEVATDLESYPEWSSEISKVDVTDRDDTGRPRTVGFWAEAFGRATHFVLQYDFDGLPDVLKWKLVEGDIEESLVGEYAFESKDDTTTEVIYRLNVELKVPMPGFVRRRAEAQILGTALQQLKVRAES